jgi:hypothetical protein
MTDPKFYATCSVETLRNIFRSPRGQQIPLFEERARVLREAGTVLQEVCRDKLGK